jgi:hypothetical protein
MIDDAVVATSARSRADRAAGIARVCSGGLGSCTPP